MSDTAPKQKPEQAKNEKGQFVTGHIGGPGRPKGSRNKLGEDFVAALHADFQENGAAVIQTVRSEKPDQYLKVIASVIPKEFHVKDVSLEDMSDDELVELLAAVRALAASDLAAKTGKRSRNKKAEEDTGGAGRPH
jgi:hypothetical protein